MDPMLKKMLDSIEEKYGHTVDYWIEKVKGSGLEKHGQMVSFLKKEHGFSHGFANTLVHVARQSSAVTSTEKPKDLVASQFEGKENLKPLYDQLIEEIKSFGEDVELAPKKAYVSLRRAKQFGIIQPSTKKRLDVGLVLKDREPKGALEPSKSFNTMCTHRVRIESDGDITPEIISWLKSAYEAAG